MRDGDGVGRGVASGTCPTRCATTGARCCGSRNQRAVEYHPTLVRADQFDHPTHLVLDLDPPEGDGFAMAVGPRTLVRAGARRRRAGRRGEDQRRQGGARLRPARRRRGARGGGRRHPGDRGPGRATRPGARHHRVRQRGPRRRGVRRLHPGRRGHGRRRLQPPDPPGHAGVVPGAWDDLDDGRPATSPIRTAPTCSATRDPWAELMPEPQQLPGVTCRGGPRHPGRPGAGHARGQAPGPRPPPGRRRGDVTGTGDRVVPYSPAHGL